MKVEIIRTFRSKKLNRIVQKGEIIEETGEWVAAIEQEGFGKGIAGSEDTTPKGKRGRPRKKILKIHGSKIETTSIEPERD